MKDKSSEKGVQEIALLIASSPMYAYAYGTWALEGFPEEWTSFIYDLHLDLLRWDAEKS